MHTDPFTYIGRTAYTINNVPNATCPGNIVVPTSGTTYTSACRSQTNISHVSTHFPVCVVFCAVFFAAGAVPYTQVLYYNFDTLTGTQLPADV